MTYEEFIQSKAKLEGDYGFDVCESELSPMLFDFQKYLVSWALRKGRAAIFADCGLGKTPMQLAWCDAITKKYNKRALILAPLAVADQTAREAQKFGIDIYHSRKGEIDSRIVITNYERLHYFNANDFYCIVLDESSILKNYAGKYRQTITEFMSTIPMRLLCSATPCPNDHMELGTSSEALGVMRRVEMLAQFFTHDGSDTAKWKLKGHGKKAFWRWMSSWARAIKKPSDIGFDDNGFILPGFSRQDHKIASQSRNDMLFPMEALTLEDQRLEKRITMDRRCSAVADIANSNNDYFVAWCQLNDESKKLASMIDGAIEITGSMDDDRKEELLKDFSAGNIRVLVTKPSIAGFGMNWQHCNAMSYFPTHSHEQFYQCSRRMWRFGQKRDVICHIVMSKSEQAILDNMIRKERESEYMFNSVIDAMHDHYDELNGGDYKATQEMEIPEWLVR